MPPSGRSNLPIRAAVAFSLIVAGMLQSAISDTWESASLMSTARVDHTTTLLADGRVLVVGGSNNSVSLASADIYDPLPNSWTSVPAMSGSRTQHAATRLTNGKVLVAGGTSNGLSTG